MTTPFARQFVCVLAIWTAIGLLSALADATLMLAIGLQVPLAALLRHALVEQWIWAALTPIVFAAARRVPLKGPRWPRALSLHAAMFITLSLAHGAIAAACGDPLAVPRGSFGGPAFLLRFLADFYSDLWMYWPLVGVRALIDTHARERERDRHATGLERSMSELKLSLLRAQIQPHFLFNTLHAISALLRVDARAAEDMVADLAEILRASFADATLQFTPLRREIELVACTLRIQQRRLGERLTVRWRIDDDVLDALIPALMLQSLVENAIQHGIAPLARACTLHIEARLDAGSLRLAVRDDGAGMGALPREGVGLANLRERLQQLHGAAHGLTIDSQPGHGTAVIVTLPCRLSSTGHSHENQPDPAHADRGRRTAGAAEPVVAA